MVTSFPLGTIQFQIEPSVLLNQQTYPSLPSISTHTHTHTETQTALECAGPKRIGMAGKTCGIGNAKHNQANRAPPREWVRV